MLDLAVQRFRQDGQEPRHLDVAGALDLHHVPVRAIGGLRAARKIAGSHVPTVDDGRREEIASYLGQHVAEQHLAEERARQERKQHVLAAVVAQELLGKRALCRTYRLWELVRQHLGFGRIEVHVEHACDVQVDGGCEPEPSE